MKRWHKPFAVLVVCLVLLGSIEYLGFQHSEKAAYADGTFTPIDLGTSFTPVGISNSGIVAGNIDDNTPSSHPAIWQSGSFTDLTSPSDVHGTVTSGISPSGEVVGSGAYTNISNYNIHALKWSGGEISIDLNGSSSTSDSCNNQVSWVTWASAANDIGDIAGQCYNVSSDYSIAGYWPGGQPDTFTPLPDISNGIGSNQALGINHNADTVGLAGVYCPGASCNGGYEAAHAAFWKNGTATDINPSGSVVSSANAINDNDLAVGHVEFTNDSVNSHPYVWDLANNHTYDLYSSNLGTGGDASAVNDSGIVVGYYYYSYPTGGTHAFVWKVGDAGVTDLNNLLPTNSGWVLENAVGINSNGQIVGEGRLNGQTHAYLLNTSTTSSYRLSLAPASQTATIRSDQGLVTATLLGGATNAPTSSVKLSFRVESGPNAGISGTCFPSDCSTDANGQVDWGYLGTAIGVDTVQVWMDTNDNGVPDTGEPQTTATVTWIQSAQAQAYVALGDSYSSGEGAPDPNFLEGTDISKGKQINLCHRSPGAYPESVHSATKSLYPVFVFRACSGAIIKDFFTVQEVGNTYINQEGNYGEPPQLSWLNSYTGLVTLTIGGNDVEFKKVMTYCAQRTSKQPSCKDKFDKVVDADINKIKNADPNNPYTLPNLYKAIRTAAPNAEVVVIGYPRLFPLNPPTSCWTGVVEPNGRRYFQASDMIWMNQKGEELDNAIKTAVAKAGPKFTYVDPLAPNSPFNGHELCTSNSYFNRAILDRTDFNIRHPSKTFQKLIDWSFHPNVSGQDALAVLTENRFKGIVQ